MSVFLALVVTAGAAAAADPMSAHDVARLRDVSGARLSPDGRHVAYTLRVPRLPGRGEDGPAWSELHVVATDEPAARPRPFVAGEVNVAQVRWTPDGKAISFVAKLAGDKHKCLYAIPLDGGQAQRIVRHATDVEGYAWNPDASAVAFLAPERESAALRRLHKQGFRQEVYEEDWRPTRVHVADVLTPRRSGEARPLDDSSSGVRTLDLPGSASEVAWSPDGKRLAVVLSPTPLVDDVMMFSRIHLVDAASGAVTGRVESVGKIAQFEFSPDGRSLALIAAEDLHDPSAGRLTVVSAEGGKPRCILPDYLGQVERIGWQGNETILYVGSEGVWTTFNRIGIDGHGRKCIVESGGAVLESLSLSRDGLAGAFVAGTPAHPSEVYFMRHGDGAPRRLTDSNPWLAEVELGRQEAIRYAARDGLEIDAILTYPVGYQSGERHPLVLVVHGGPEAHFSNGWNSNYNRPAHVLAGRGFFVLHPNYRGSTGRGVEFSKADQHDYGGKEFDDLIDGIDHLVEKGMVDVRRVGVTGGSYGGYATAYCATRHTERFAAGVMFIGLSDHPSFFGTSDIPQEWYLVHARALPWDEPEFYRDRSPLTHATRCRTPLLIAHGKDDPRVHPSQSLMLYRYLKFLGRAPVRLVWYPGEGHGNANAGARHDYCVRLVQWMEHYLKGPGGAPPAYEVDYGLAAFGETEAADDDEE